jgi:hypothetical protein
VKKPLTIGDITNECSRLHGFPVPVIDEGPDDDDDDEEAPLFLMDHIPHTNC